MEQYIGLSSIDLLTSYIQGYSTHVGLDPEPGDLTRSSLSYIGRNITITSALLDCDGCEHISNSV